MSSIERVQATNSKSINRFSFCDYGFSEFVRQKMLESLVDFDLDKDELFDESQIRQALIQILHQNPNEVYYVIQNVFRYDRDNDKKVTYKEFINFSVQQHFGELAIQRLHRQKTYAHGDKRIMSMSEFIKTMEYSLNTIGVHGPDEVYDLLFGEVDLDRDGFISYEDYFVFLKEYFGSKSESQARGKVPDKAPLQDNFQVDNSAFERFAKLIYNQLKIITMQIDYNRKMRFQVQQVQRFISQVLQAGQQEVEVIANMIMADKSSLGYEEFLQLIGPFYFCQYYVNVTGLREQTINLELFLQVVKDASTSVVAVGPSEKTAKSIFYLTNGGPDTIMNIQQYIMLMGSIFEHFKFDRRGLGRRAN